MNSSEKDMDFSDSLASSDEFNRTIGCIEDIVISPEFQQLQTNFLNEHCMRFTNEEENKIFYMDIFNEYTNIIETFIMDNLKRVRHDIDMNRFQSELRANATKFDGEIYEFLYSLSDFITFKNLMLDFKEFKLNESNLSALNDCFIVTKLQ